ncbi:MAG: Crp/Fnr family transcriptional regulator, partial [Deltaproteobacteria bacterium]|nr:Crp/Fnr family transcriptional regulator [Deltaproteobacteria bacterium]
MKKILHIIAEAPLFNGLSEDQLNQVRQIAVDKFYDK